MRPSLRTAGLTLAVVAMTMYTLASASVQGAVLCVGCDEAGFGLGPPCSVTADTCCGGHEPELPAEHDAGLTPCSCVDVDLGNAAPSVKPSAPDVRMVPPGPALLAVVGAEPLVHALSRGLDVQVRGPSPPRVQQRPILLI